MQISLPAVLVLGLTLLCTTRRTASTLYNRIRAWLSPSTTEDDTTVLLNYAVASLKAYEPTSARLLNNKLVAYRSLGKSKLLLYASKLGYRERILRALDLLHVRTSISWLVWNADGRVQINGNICRRIAHMSERVTPTKHTVSRPPRSTDIGRGKA